MDVLSQWKDLESYHKNQLSNIEKKIKECEYQLGISEEILIKNIVNLETRSSKKDEWRNVVEGGLLQNIREIFNEDTYHAYLESFYEVSSSPTKAERNVAKERCEKIKEYIGPFDSPKWKLFVYRVIELLKRQGSFDDEDGSFHDFEDTAGGCDEVAWNAGVEILERMDELTWNAGLEIIRKQISVQ